MVRSDTGLINRSSLEALTRSTSVFHSLGEEVRWGRRWGGGMGQKKALESQEGEQSASLLRLFPRTRRLPPHEALLRAANAQETVVPFCSDMRADNRAAGDIHKMPCHSRAGLSIRLRENERQGKETTHTKQRKCGGGGGV